MSSLEKDTYLESLERHYAVQIIYDSKTECYNIYTFFGHLIDSLKDINKIEYTIIEHFGPSYFGLENYNNLKLKLKEI